MDAPLNTDTEDRVGVIVYDLCRRIVVVEGPSGKLSFPKGCRQFGETEWEGAMREAWEETGLDLEALPHVLYQHKVKLLHGTYFVFHMNLDGATLPLKPQEGESKRIYWAKPTAQLFTEKPTNADLSVFLSFASLPTADARGRKRKALKIRIDVRGAGLVRWGTTEKIAPKRRVQFWAKKRTICC